MTSPQAGEDPFPAMCREGYRWQVWLAERLQALGWRTEVDALKIRPTLADYKDYGDSGDVRVFAKSGGRRNLAVKSVRTPFSGKHDYPFSTVIVDSVTAWEKTPAAAVVRISQPTGGIIVIPATTRNAWARATFKTPDGPKVCYVVATSLCRTFDELVGWLEAT